MIYVSKEGDWEPSTGSYFGELTEELNGNHITTFVSGGPKNSSYKLNTGKTVCKVRGITLNYRTQQDVNFEVMSNMVKVVYPLKIVRNRNEKSVLTKSETKDYRIVYIIIE